MNFFEDVQVRRAAVVALWLLVAFLAVLVISGLESLRYIGTGVAAANTIQVSGHGEVFATPDIATFTYSVVSDKSTVAAAQTADTAQANAVMTYLTSQNVATSDIQTTGYDVEPQYQYETTACPINPLNGAATAGCTSGNQVLVGYEVTQTNTVKVRDTSQAGTLLTGVGTAGATNVSGLTFTFDNPEAVQDEARQKAIADAQSKAQELAKELGVSIVSVVSFTENQGGNSPQPVVYSMASGATAASAPSPEISTGQNDITDDVTVTYEIK